MTDLILVLMNLPQSGNDFPSAINKQVASKPNQMRLHTKNNFLLGVQSWTSSFITPAEG